jgi:tRNA nucleotidyltransferase (CCA-adding enzyme)
MHGMSETTAPTPVAGGEELLSAIAAQPGGPQLLALAGQREDLALVGGAVRDLLLGRAPRELDVVVAQGAADLANALASRLGTLAGENPSERFESTYHERFRTALVRWNGGQIDIATRRAESYATPGALPDVRPGSAEEDLRRRDFTVNAIAVALGGDARGQLQSAEHALEDLRAGRLRVLHERSFSDDPTRLLRLARYCARLGFAVEPHTAELAAQALAGGSLETVSRARVGAELRLALRESDAVAALVALSELGVLPVLAYAPPSSPASSSEGDAAREPMLRLDAPLARRALALLPADGRPDLLLIASLLLAPTAGDGGDPDEAVYELLDGLEFTAAERERIIRTVRAAPALVAAIADAAMPSQLHDALSAHTLEAVALAGALSDRGPASVSAKAADWLERLRHVRLAINGDDLLAAGIAAGPQLGMRLDAALARKLDGELDDGRDAELRAALEATVASPARDDAGEDARADVDR